MNSNIVKVMRDVGQALLGLADLLGTVEVSPARKEPVRREARQGATLDPSGLSGKDFQRMLQASGMTQSQLASKLGVSNTTVKLWIAKRGRPLPKGRVDAVKAALQAQPPSV